MTAAHLRAGLHLIYLVAPLVRLACTERNGCACPENRLCVLSKVARPRLSWAKKPGLVSLPGRGSDRARFTPTTVRDKKEYFNEIQDVKVTKERLDLAKHIVTSRRGTSSRTSSKTTMRRRWPTSSTPSASAEH